MHRVFILPGAIHGDHITVDDPRDVHHLLRVLRVNVQEPLECFDGTGTVYRGRISRCALSSVTMAVERRSHQPPPQPRLRLAQALIQPQRFEWLLQKVTELGVGQVIPLVTERTVVRRAQDCSRQRLLRWRRIASDAALQCGRALLPVVEAPTQFADFVKTLAASPAIMPTLVEPSAPLDTHLKQLTGHGQIVVLIGPEGDFTPEEVALARRHGVRTATLGHATLRSETAALVTVTILQHAFGVL